MYIPPGQCHKAALSPAPWPPHRCRPCWPSPPNSWNKPLYIFEMENKILIQFLVNVTGAVTVSKTQVPWYKIKAVRVSTKQR
jgi:hypothetical protein